MSIIQYPEAINAENLLSPPQKLGLHKCPPAAKDDQNLQVWNNAAFDDDESAVRTSWMQPSLLEMKSSKENQSPNLCKSRVFDETPAPPNKNLSVGKPPKLLFKQEYLDAAKNREGQVDDEIDEIEKEIARLSERLEALRIQKKNQNPAVDESAVARDAPGKIPEKKSLKTPKKIEELPPGVNSRRRGVSLGPAEILGNVRSRPMETPQSRRKSLFWKLPGIEEEDADKKGQKKTQKSISSCRSRSLSPKSRAAKTADPRKGISTVGAKKPVKKNDTPIQPKKLFPERPAGAQRPGRFVASRYNQIAPRVTGNSPSRDRRKGSIPETDKKDNRRKSRGVSSGSDQAPSVTHSGARRRWDIPEESSPPPVADIGEILPKIRTSRIANESPRDSGCAKRVADLVGKKTFFGREDGEVVTSLCLVLGFEEEE